MRRPAARIPSQLLLGLALVLLPASAGAVPRTPPAQGEEPTVVAQLTQGVAKLGEDVSIQVTVDGSFDARIVGIPPVDGLDLGPVGGPSRRETQSIVGRRRTIHRLLTWTIPVRSLRAGDFEIPPLEVEVEGRRLRTRPLSLKIVQDLRGESLGFLEIHTYPERIYEGQPFSLEVRFGWDMGSNTNAVLLSLPWWGEVPGLVPLEDPVPPPSARLVNGVLINDTIQATAEELDPIERDGRTYRVLRITRNFLPSRSETTELPKSFMEFGEQVRRQSFFGTSAEWRNRYFVSTEFSFDVQPLPTEGQPADFSGAIGTFAASATVDSRDVQVGDSIKLTVTWTGKGNFAFFDPPDPSHLDAFRGFRLYGTTGEKAVDSRRVTYDLAPLNDAVTEIPALPLSVFDPERGEYTTVETAPVPIRVRPLAEASGLEAEGARGLARDIEDVDPRPLSTVAEGPGPDDRLIGSLLFLVPALWFALRTLVRRRRGDPAGPLERRRRKARRRLARDLARAREPEEVLHAVQAFLAARTREPDGAWIGRAPDVWNAERANGDALPASEAEDLARMIARLEGATYGGGRDGTGAPDRTELLGLADRIVRAGL